MPQQIQVAGLATIYVSSGTGISALGITRDGVNITFNGFFLDVPTDASGGEAGPPADKQFMGSTARIRCEFTKYDESVAAVVRSRSSSTLTDGTFLSVGELMIQGGYTSRLVVNSPTQPYNFPVVMFDEPQEINKGTKFSTYVVEATAYENSSGVLWNTTTT